MKTAVLVDGAFYKKRSELIYGKMRPDDWVENLMSQCFKHLKHKGSKSELYRIFYYDCEPLGKKVTHPLTGKTIDYSKTDDYKEGMEFLDLLRHKRKVALRLGKLTGNGSDFILPSYNVKKICNEKLTFDKLKPNHFKLSIRQKGVDMRLGIDIASLSYKKQVDRIVLIAGDSDFVPAAKLARREGIDFILDPMWNQVSSDLVEHVDGLYSKCDKPKKLIEAEAKAKKNK